MYIYYMKERKIKIIQKLSFGWTAETIAAYFSLSKRTIEKDIENIKSEYGAKNSAHLVAIALREKIIS